MADWVAIADDDLLKCPYCPASVAKRRFLLHLTPCYAKAGDKTTRKSHPIQVCPFNREHHFLRDSIGAHFQTCRDALVHKSRVFDFRSVPSSTLTIAESRKLSPKMWMRTILGKRVDLSELIEKVIKSPQAKAQDTVSPDIYNALSAIDQYTLDSARLLAKLAEGGTSSEEQ